MEDSTWIVLISALGGALIGGFASAYGSHLVTTVDRKREIRTYIYRELLPAVWTQPTGPKLQGPTAALYDDLWRSAITCGSPDNDYLVEIMTNYELVQQYGQEAHENRVENELGSYEADPHLWGLRNKYVQKLNDSLYAYNVFLERKFR